MQCLVWLASRSTHPLLHTHTTCLLRTQSTIQCYTQRGHLPAKQNPMPSPVTPSLQKMPIAAARDALAAADAGPPTRPPLLLDSLAASTRAGLFFHSSDMKLMGPNPAATLKAERVSSVPSMDDNLRRQNRSFLKMTCQKEREMERERDTKREG